MKRQPAPTRVLRVQGSHGFVIAGFADARSSKVYQRGPDGPGVEPPPVPDDYLSDEWKAYLEGWRSGVQDNVRDILKKAAS